MTQHTGNCLLVMILCTMDRKRLLVESEGFITLVCSFTISKSTNVKPYPTLLVPLYQPLALQLKLFKKLLQEEARGTSLFFSSPLPRLTYHLRPLLPAVVTLQSYPPHHRPACLCDLGFTLLHPPSLSLRYKQSQSHHNSDLRRLVIFQYLHNLPKQRIPQVPDLS